MTKSRKLRNFQDKIRLCLGCPYSNCRTNVVTGYSENKDPNIILISDYPGKTEDRTSIPFTGKSGMELNKVLEEIGFNVKQIYFTNVLKCIPLDADDNLANPLKTNYVLCFKKWFKQEVDIVEPILIITAGGIANDCILGSKNIRTLRLSSENKHHEYNNIRVIPTYNPVCLVRNDKDISDMFYEDIQKAFRYYESFDGERSQSSKLRLF